MTISQALLATGGYLSVAFVVFAIWSACQPRLDRRSWPNVVAAIVGGAALVFFIGGAWFGVTK